MLKIKGNYFILETNHTSMLIKGDGRAEYLYYGERVPDFSGAEWLSPEVYWDGAVHPLSLFLQAGRGEAREPSVSVRFADGSYATDFRFVRARIVPRPVLEGLPSAYGEAKSLKLEFLDEPSRLKLCLYYTAFADSDAITVCATLTNGGKRPVSVLSFASLHLEVWGNDFSFTTFDGAWASERRRHTRPLECGKCENASYIGSSSAFHNPFVLLGRKGDVYGVNLIYSGNHREFAESDATRRTRLVTGINPYQFDWELAPGETFFAPEAVMVYGKTDEEVSERMHEFVSRHIVRGKWKDRERPVLVNNWEGTYFNFTREKILNIARKAAEAGAELFVLDDGWFGKRDSDTCSLGDWTDYAEKTGGLESLADEVRAMGLKFGIWVEPEMISEDSELYRKHPEYAMKIARRDPQRMRHQLMLNLVDPQVQGYVFRAVSRVITMCKAAYVKWDYNRYMTDCFDRNTRGGEYFHRYMLGLYSVISRLVERFPNVLFESCAGGGSRFDLGMLCFMPQTWTSDNTDARERTVIQSGTAYAYPQSTMGAHVTASPNEQTGNSNSLQTRFNVACGGVLGYESDLTKADEAELDEIRAQIAFYKKYRSVLQFGVYHRLGDALNGEWSGFITVARDGSKAVSVIAVPEKRTGELNLRVKFAGLDENALYSVKYRRADGSFVPVCQAHGAMLNRGSFALQNLFSETDVRSCSNPLYTRLFVFEKVSARKKRS